MAGRQFATANSIFSSKICVAGKYCVYVDFKAKLHCHHEHYEKLKQLQQAERRRKSSYIPSNSRFYTYYSRQAQIHPSDSDEWETDTSQEWSNTALQRVKAVIEAFSKMPSKPLIPFWELPSESGVGGSSLLGTSMPKMDGEDKGRQGEVEGSSGFFTEVDLLGQGSMPERPMSKLTVRNLQKHDAISGKAKVVLDDVSLDAITVQFWMVYKASSYSLLLSHSILKPKYWPVVAGDSVPSEIVTHTANCEEIFV